MAIELIVQPRKQYTWEHFCKNFPPYAIALDGLVKDRTLRDSSGPYANFDHHSNVDRSSTRSTSDQVALEINMGLFKTFCKDGIPTAKVYVNDADEDTCLAYWLLLNHERVIGHGEPCINRLIYMEDRLDVTAGAYPFRDSAMRRTMAWIFEPYNAIRFQGLLNSINANEMRNIIEAVLARITRYTLGDSEELALEGQYEVIGGGSNWKMVKETGPAARLAMYNDGIEAFVSVVSDKSDHYVYSVGRKSQWIKFPLKQIFRSLSASEICFGNNITETNDWGPKEEDATIGGSPKQTGSLLKPSVLEETILKAIMVQEVTGSI